MKTKRKPKTRKIHPTAKLAAERVYAECFSPDGKPAHAKLARQMEDIIEEIVGVSRLNEDRSAILVAWLEDLKTIKARLDKLFPHVTIERDIT